MKINLLPRQEYLKYIDKKQIIENIVAGVLVAVAIVVISGGVLGGVIQAKKMHLDRLVKTHQEYIKLKKDVANIKNKIKSIKKEGCS